MSLSCNLQQYRGERNWSQQRLAIEAKLPQSAISDIETGKRRNPGIRTLTKLSRALKISMDELIS